jgi:hypothetical protein
VVRGSGATRFPRISESADRCSFAFGVVDLASLESDSDILSLLTAI